MRNINFKFTHHICGQSITEYTLLFAAIVLTTLFVSNILLQRTRTMAESQREQAVQRILGSGSGGGP